MINIVVIITVKNESDFVKFESQAIRILRLHGGELVAAFEPENTDASSIDDIEVHYIRFPAIENYNKARPKGHRYLRYQNSVDTDFGKMVYGIDECTENTHTLIGVEGITDKFNVDRLLGLYKQEEIKCGAFFGKKISPEQMLFFSFYHWLISKRIYLNSIG